MPSLRSWFATYGTSLIVPRTIQERLLTSSTARTSILAFLKKAAFSGYLRVEDSEGAHEYGSKSYAGISVHIRVRTENFWTRVFL